MSNPRTTADFQPGGRYRNLLGRILTITGVDDEAGTIDYVYDTDEWHSEPWSGSRLATITAGWEKL